MVSVSPWLGPRFFYVAYNMFEMGSKFPGVGPLMWRTRRMSYFIAITHVKHPYNITCKICNKVVRSSDPIISNLIVNEKQIRSRYHLHFVKPHHQQFELVNNMKPRHTDMYIPLPFHALICLTRPRLQLSPYPPLRPTATHLQDNAREPPNTGLRTMLGLHAPPAYRTICGGGS